MLVMAFTEDDLGKMSAGESEPDLIDCGEAMRSGFALPTMVQVIAVKDQAEFELRMQAWFDNNNAGIDISQFRLMSDLPKLWNEESE